MSKVTEGLKRLNALLPFKERQIQMGEKLASVHKEILSSFVERGRPLNNDEISQLIGGGDVDAALKTLKENDLVILGEDNTVTGSYPMTIEDTIHKIKVNGQEINAMCALDSLAISPMFGKKVQIESKCHATGEPIHLEQDGADILEARPSEDVCCGFIWKGAPGCSGTEMVFLKDKDTAETWVKERSDRELYDLDEAIEFSSGFFVPLVQ